MGQAQRHNALDDLGWGGLRMALVNRRQVFESFEPLQLKAPLVLVKLGARHAALAAGDTDVAQRLSELEHTQALMGELVGRVLAHTASSPSSGASAFLNGAGALDVTDEA